MPVDGSLEFSSTRTSVGADRGGLRFTEPAERCLRAGMLFLSVLWASPFSLAQQPVAPSVGVKPQPPKTETAESLRKKQISSQSTQLLAMALALKAEVDKTNKDTLSMKVIRKADEIERLAKTLKENAK